MNFLEFAEKVIFEANRPLTKNEIWEIGKSKGYDSNVNSTGKTPWASIGARIYVDIKDNPNSVFTKLKLKPVRFFLKRLSDKIDVEKIQEQSEKIEVQQESKYHERLLHKYLSWYVYTYHHFIYTKTIFHEESNKKKFGQWLHPDIVGCSFSFEDFEPEVLDISKEVGCLGVKLFSYELKKELNFNNLRESFFQAVSNSSWANEGYLVAAEIDMDEEFQAEIKRLSSSFGIGVIRLDIKEPDSSEILFSALEKDIVDIETINKMALVNPNFKDFLRRIKLDISTREIRKEQYDKIFDVEILVNGKGLKL